MENIQNSDSTGVALEKLEKSAMLCNNALERFQNIWNVNATFRMCLQFYMQSSDDLKANFEGSNVIYK